MKQEIVDCLDFDTGNSNTALAEVLAERLSGFVKDATELSRAKEEAVTSVLRKNDIIDFPLQDTFWSLTELLLKHKDISKWRMLVLSDTGTSHSSTIQFSLEPASQISYEDQAMQLVCLGCCHPLDGRKSRKPRFMNMNIAQDIRNTIQTEVDKLGIWFCGSILSKEELDSTKKSFKSSAYFRQCSVCGISGTSTLFDDCDNCGAVIYCGDKCKTDDSQESHQNWCINFKQFMAEDTELAALPFDFASETTNLDFHEPRKKDFLNKCGIFGQGLWHLEYQPSQEDMLSSKHETKINVDGFSVYGLESESSLLEIRPQPPDRALNGWRDYYSLRGFPTHSPIAVLLHFPLTLYYIITQLLFKDFSKTFTRIQESNEICVHVIGAEKEVEMFFPFLECARLLAPLSLDIRLFGNNFAEAYDGQLLKMDNLNFQIHRGLYHKTNHEHIPAPSLAVCFNGGIGAYSSYMKTIKTLLRNKTPLYYTDYGQACIMFSRDAILNSKAGCVSQPLINPFRSPLRMVASDQNLPRYSNAFISHIKPFTSNS